MAQGHKRNLLNQNWKFSLKFKGQVHDLIMDNVEVRKPGKWDDRCWRDLKPTEHQPEVYWVL
eukprot:gene5891-2497_t